MPPKDVPSDGVIAHFTCFRAGKTLGEGRVVQASTTLLDQPGPLLEMGPCPRVELAGAIPKPVALLTHVCVEVQHHKFLVDLGQLLLLGGDLQGWVQGSGQFGRALGFSNRDDGGLDLNDGALGLMDGFLSKGGLVGQSGLAGLHLHSNHLLLRLSGSLCRLVLDNNGGCQSSGQKQLEEITLKKCLLGLTECPPNPAAGGGKAASSSIGPIPGGWDEVEGWPKDKEILPSLRHLLVASALLVAWARLSAESSAMADAEGEVVRSFQKGRQSEIT